MKTNKLTVLILIILYFFLILLLGNIITYINGYIAFLKQQKKNEEFWGALIFLFYYVFNLEIFSLSFIVFLIACLTNKKIRGEFGIEIATILLRDRYYARSILNIIEIIVTAVFLYFKLIYKHIIIPIYYCHPGPLPWSSFDYINF
uniref:Uncharacterized protein n=1 Tax=Babesia duncani TaxID=323732 RepID=A0A385GNL2_9APIC|nr:hypothetical protein [Babesia duncani]